MKRAMQFASLAAVLVCAGVVFASARAAQGGGQARTPINPAVTYSKNCATCHGKDGRANTFKSKHHLHARDLTDARWQSDVTDERRSEEHTSELQSLAYLVCRLLLEK